MNCSSWKHNLIWLLLCPSRCSRASRNFSGVAAFFPFLLNGALPVFESSTLFSSQNQLTSSPNLPSLPVPESFSQTLFLFSLLLFSLPSKNRSLTFPQPDWSLLFSLKITASLPPSLSPLLLFLSFLLPFSENFISLFWAAEYPLFACRESPPQAILIPSHKRPSLTSRLCLFYVDQNFTPFWTQLTFPSMYTFLFSFTKTSFGNFPSFKDVGILSKVNSSPFPHAK